MPRWLLLILVIAGLIAWTGLMAAGAMGNWRTFWLASKQFALVLAGLGALAAVVLLGMFIINS
jgi:hypothetical protein